MAFYPYPEGMPVEEIKCVIAAVRGTCSESLAVKVQAGWVVAGFGLKHIPHEQPLVFGNGHDVAVLLEDSLAMRGEPAESVPEGFIPWPIIIPLVIDLIREWLKHRT